VIHYDPRWSGPHGIGRFSDEVMARVGPAQALRLGVPKLSLLDPVISTVAAIGLREGVYFSPGFNPPLRAGVPFVFCIHDLIHLRFAPESSAARRMYYRMVVRPGAHRAFKVLTVSSHSRDTILEWSGLPPAQVEVVGCGVGAAFRPEGRRHSAGKPYFLHVGRRQSHKNIPRLLEAYAQSRCRQDTALHFTGDADDEILRHAKQLDVHFTGTLSDAELAEHYRGALALVFPSMYEGFGIPVAEAMACGTPVLTTRAAALAETVGEGNALVVEPERTESIAQALDRLVEDSNLRETLRARGLAQAPRFSWDLVASRVAAVLATAAAAPARPGRS
jgi:glycosyltransferase involved in cell wall biosynthesis